MTTVRALLLPAAGDAELRDIDGGDLRGLQQLVGGYLEAVDLGHVWINEDGKLHDLPVNAGATALWWTAVDPGPFEADMLVGDAVVLGDGPDGAGGRLPAVGAGPGAAVTGGSVPRMPGGAVHPGGEVMTGDRLRHIGAAELASVGYPPEGGGLILRGAVTDGPAGCAGRRVELTLTVSEVAFLLGCVAGKWPAAVTAVAAVIAEPDVGRYDTVTGARGRRVQDAARTAMLTGEAGL